MHRARQARIPVSAAVVDRIPLWRAKTMSIESKSSKRPPAIRKAGSPMPSKRRAICPTRAITTSVIAATAIDLIAVRRRRSLGWRYVSATNSGSIPTGSMMTRNVMKTAAANSSMLSAGFPDACRDWRRVLVPHQAKKASFRLPASKFMGCRTFGSFQQRAPGPLGRFI
jgi:hypothetical protein